MHGSHNGPVPGIVLLACVCCRRLSASSVVVCNAAGGRAGRRERGRSGGRHYTAGQYGDVPLGRHLVKQATQLTCIHTGTPGGPGLPISPAAPGFPGIP